ncbi:hypothetical protein CEXT_658611 [Caerostris extrusa]|uniref:Uncharacterized protein n=1 Tax=Caerostris extrusa TaxID=172846 RepID=A0AAV4XMX8_CAEEX|nr:hypothetical protein CEXT_658611 [Caerostris extrusa]
MQQLLHCRQQHVIADGLMILETNFNSLTKRLKLKHLLYVPEDTKLTTLQWRQMRSTFESQTYTDTEHATVHYIVNSSRRQLATLQRRERRPAGLKVKFMPMQGSGGCSRFTQAGSQADASMPIHGERKRKS